MKILKKGVEYIRIAPTNRGDYSFTDNSLIFDRFDKSGRCLHFRKERYVNSNIISQSIMLSCEFMDDNWIEFNEIKNISKTSLHDLKGELIKRVKPVIFVNCSDINTPNQLLLTVKDCSYMTTPVKLIAATIYHVVVNNFGREEILDIRYTNPDDWIKV